MIRDRKNVTLLDCKDLMLNILIQSQWLINLKTQQGRYDNRIEEKTSFKLVLTTKILSDSNGIRTNNHLVHNQPLSHLAKLDLND